MLLTKIAETTDGKAVVSGVYKTFETHGLPLDVLIGSIRDKNAIPCWVSFHQEAVAAGMKHERILSKLDEALSDVYGPAFRDHIIKTLRLLHEKGLL